MTLPKKKFKQFFIFVFVSKFNDASCVRKDNYTYIFLYM